ncbi:hypothetical protein TNCV_3094901 [Trichonephila clavipes]|nr:hypothetical protein TNCV_3094901 [Trichonephila clavipes]
MWTFSSLTKVRSKVDLPQNLCVGIVLSWILSNEKLSKRWNETKSTFLAAYQEADDSVKTVVILWLAVALKTLNTLCKYFKGCQVVMGSIRGPFINPLEEMLPNCGLSLKPPSIERI